MSVGILINYVDRVNISYALIPISEDLSLDAVEQGIVLSAFAWGYVLFGALGGVLVDKLGAVRVAGGAAVGWSAATAWTGLASGFPSLLASRVAIGAGESPIFPADARLVRDEFPLHERGRATALFDAGSYIGTALSAPIVVFVMTTWGWRASFLVCSALGLIWAVAWLRFAPKLTGDRSEFCSVGSERECSKGIRAAPWDRAFFQLLRNRKVLGASCGFFCYNYAKSFFLTWFPAYMVKERGFTFLAVGVVGMIPPLCAVVGEFLAGSVTDRLIMRGVSVTVARKTPLCIGMVLAASVAGAAFVSSKIGVLAVLSFAFASTIAASPGIWALPGDIAPSQQYVGTIGGIQNTFSNCAGIVAPIVTGAIVTWTGSFGSALVVSAVIAVCGALSYWFIVGQLEPIQLEASP